MALLGFTVFKDKLLDGSKRQTIRKLRKRPIKVGDRLHLYWHLRRKDCEKLEESFFALQREITCTETFFITMQFDPNFLNSGKPVWRIDRYENPSLSGDFRTLFDHEVEDLARRDGFDNALQMMRWFYVRYPLYSTIFQVIRW